MVYDPFSLRVINKEGLCPSSRDINTLMVNHDSLVISKNRVQKVVLDNGHRRERIVSFLTKDYFLMGGSRNAWYKAIIHTRYCISATLFSSQPMLNVNIVAVNPEDIEVFIIRINILLRNLMR
jgi:hypothetical protein